jgi:hypothetical protein
MKPPTAAEELMLLSVSSARTRSAAGQRARELAARTDWRELLRLLTRQRLVPLAAARLAELDGVEPPDAFAAAAAEATTAARRLALHNEIASERVLAALAESGIAARTLKGAALAAELYGDGGMRISQDVDVLVKSDRLASAAAALERIGFARAGGSATGRRPPLHVRLVHRGGLPDVELHWRVHWYEERFSAELLARAGAAHEYAALLLFWARDGFAGLRLAADIARWWDMRGERLPDEALVAVAERHPALRRPLAVAAWNAQRLVGVPSPFTFRRPPPAVRLGTWRLAGDDDQIRANTTLIDLLLAPPNGRGDFVRRHVLLPDAVLLERGAARNRLGRARALHVLRLAARYIIALWRIRGGREWAPPPSRTDPTTRRPPTARR